MRILSGSLPSILVLLLVEGCRTVQPPPPLILYSGALCLAWEICVMEVARTAGAEGHATVDVQEIVRIGADPEISCSARPRSGWTPPQDFMGPTPTQHSGPKKDP